MNSRPRLKQSTLLNVLVPKQGVKLYLVRVVDIIVGADDEKNRKPFDILIMKIKIWAEEYELFNKDKDLLTMITQDLPNNLQGLKDKFAALVVKIYRKYYRRFFYEAGLLDATAPGDTILLIPEIQTELSNYIRTQHYDLYVDTSENTLTEAQIIKYNLMHTKSIQLNEVLLPSHLQIENEKNSTEKTSVYDLSKIIHKSRHPNAQFSRCSDQGEKRLTLSQIVPAKIFNPATKDVATTNTMLLYHSTSSGKTIAALNLCREFLNEEEEEKDFQKICLYLNSEEGMKKQKAGFEKDYNFVFGVQPANDMKFAGLGYKKYNSRDVLTVENLNQGDFKQSLIDPKKEKRFFALDYMSATMLLGNFTWATGSSTVRANRPLESNSSHSSYQPLFRNILRKAGSNKRKILIIVDECAEFIQQLPQYAAAFHETMRNPAWQSACKICYLSATPFGFTSDQASLMLNMVARKKRPNDENVTNEGIKEKVTSQNYGTDKNLAQQFEDLKQNLTGRISFVQVHNDTIAYSIAQAKTRTLSLFSEQNTSVTNKDIFQYLRRHPENRPFTIPLRSKTLAETGQNFIEKTIPLAYLDSLAAPIPRSTICKKGLDDHILEYTIELSKGKDERQKWRNMQNELEGLTKCIFNKFKVTAPSSSDWCRNEDEEIRRSFNTEEENVELKNDAEKKEEKKKM